MAQTKAQHTSKEIAILCARLLDEKKLEDIQIIDVREALQITDYFVIASGANSRQMRTASDQVSKLLREEGVGRHGQEGYGEGKWVLLDFDDVVVHLFQRDSRRYYDLELLWGDCPRVEGWSISRRPGGAVETRDSQGADSEGPAESEPAADRLPEGRGGSGAPAE